MFMKNKNIKELTNLQSNNLKYYYVFKVKNILDLVMNKVLV